MKERICQRTGTDESFWRPPRIGIRESRHVRALHPLTAEEMLTGKRLLDAIANGTYHIDVHNAKGAGVAFRPQGEVPMIRHEAVRTNPQ